MNFDELVQESNPDLGPICVALRELVSELHSEFLEIIWPNQKIASYGVGPKKMSEHYVYIAPQAKHVNLGFYHGASIADPDSLLEGTGKKLRHIKVRNVDAVDKAAVRSLIQAAIEERRQALA